MIASTIRGRLSGSAVDDLHQSSGRSRGRNSGLWANALMRLLGVTGAAIGPLPGAWRWWRAVLPGQCLAGGVGSMGDWLASVLWYYTEYQSSPTKVAWWSLNYSFVSVMGYQLR